MLSRRVLVASCLVVALTANSTLAQPAKPKDGPLGMKFVPLPKGTFYIGGGGDRGPPGGPTVEIEEEFEIAIYTVTQGQWQELMIKNPSFFSRQGAGKDRVKDIKDEDLKEFPVEQVSWDDAQEFIKKLNEKENGKGYRYRLPDQFEWEYACRGGATSEEECSFHFYFEKPTNDLSSKQANFHGDYPFGKGDQGPYLGRTTKVGSYTPNKLGLYDMHGNVCQWCEAWGDVERFYRVFRGGSWCDHHRHCQAAAGGRRAPTFRGSGLGFRLTRVLVRPQLAKPAPAKAMDGPLGMKFVPLPKATFYTGGGIGGVGLGPAVISTQDISENFEIAIHTVTQVQWQEMMGKNPSYFSRFGGGKDKVKDIKDEELKQFPVEQVSWDDTQEFIKKLNEKEKGKGYQYRLPDQIEWEYACRGGATSPEECSFHFYVEKPTNDLSSKQANFHGDYRFGKADQGPYLGRTTKVGSYAPNKLGLFDMHGNVWQWCDNPDGKDRGIRGGSWFDDRLPCSAAFYDWCARTLRSADLGFRLARVSVNPEPIPKPKNGPPVPVRPEPSKAKDGPLVPVNPEPIPKPKAGPLGPVKPVPPKVKEGPLGMYFVPLPKATAWSDQKDAFGDPLPFGAIARIGTTRYRLPETRDPRLFALSRDGKLLAVLGGNADDDPDHIEVWELPAWKHHRSIKAASIDKNNPRLGGLAFFPDGKKLITFDIHQNIYLHDLATGKSIKKLPLNPERVPKPKNGPLVPVNRDLVTARFTLLGDGQTLVGVFRLNDTQEVQLWDISNGKMTRSFRIPLDRFSGYAPPVISADGRWLAQNVHSGRGAELVTEIWDLGTGKLARQIESDLLLFRSAFSPDGKWLAGSNGAVLRIYDTAAGKEKHNIRLPLAPISHLEFSPDSSSLYLADHYGKVHRWNPVSGERAASHSIPVPTVVRQLAFPADGKVLALGFGRQAVHFWEVATGKVLSPTDVPVSSIYTVAFSNHGELFVGAEDGMLAWWNPRTGAKLRDLRLDFGVLEFDDIRLRSGIRFKVRVRRRNEFVTVSPSGEFLVANVGENSFGFHDAKTGKLLYDVSGGRGSKMPPSTDFLDGGSKAASIEGKKVRIWNTRTGRDLATFDIPLRPQDRAGRLSASPNGKFFALATGMEIETGMEKGRPDGRGFLYDVEKQKVIREWNLKNGPNFVNFSPDGQWLVLDVEKNRIRLARVAAKGEAVLNLDVPGVKITAIAFSPDGRQLACSAILPQPSGETSRIFIYELASQKIRLVLVGHPNTAIECLAFAHDSGLLASGASDTTALVWQSGLRASPAKPAVKDATDTELADWLGQTASADPKAAFQNMIKLAQVPRQTVKLFDAKIAPAKKPDSNARSVAAWIQDLSSGQFAVRSKAATTLHKIGSTVEPDLRAALLRAHDAETKRRIEELLAHFATHEYTAEEVLQIRAVEVLEVLATPEARALLTRWADGNPGTVLTTEARQALARVAKAEKLSTDNQGIINRLTGSSISFEVASQLSCILGRSTQ